MRKFTMEDFELGLTEIYGCKHCGCLKLENKDLGICATCNKELRKPVKEKKKPVPIKKVSKPMKINLTEYSHLRKQFLIDNPICAVYPDKKAVSIHHKKGRIGDLLCDVKYWLPTSLEGHIYIEENPAWAKEQGFSLSRESKS